MAYTRSIKLEHNQIPAKIDMETGEIIELSKCINKFPDNTERWLQHGSFHKTYTHTGEFLIKTLKPVELSVVMVMSIKAEPNTNALIPLDDDTTVRQLEQYFNVSKNRIKGILDKLFKLGIFARFEVATEDNPHMKYWILNPYVSFKGRLVDSDIVRLFQGTIIEKEYSKKSQSKIRERW